MRPSMRRAITSAVAAVAVAGATIVVTSAPAQAAVADTIRSRAISLAYGLTWSQVGLTVDEAWCADFVRKVWHDSGVDGTDTINGLASSLRDNYGHMNATPHVGDAVLFRWSGRAADEISHVAIVVDVNYGNHTIRSVGGNENGLGWSDGVTHLDGPYGSDVGTSGGGAWDGTIVGYVPPARIIRAGGSLNLNQQWSSPNNRATLRLQTDGNLVVKDEGGGARWGAGTEGGAAALATFQPDGNLVVYDSSHRPLWSSQTDGHPGASLWLQQDGNVVIYDSGNRPLWSTRTGH